MQYEQIFPSNCRLYYFTILHSETKTSPGDPEKLVSRWCAHVAYHPRLPRNRIVSVPYRLAGPLRRYVVYKLWGAQKITACAVARLESEVPTLFFLHRPSVRPLPSSRRSCPCSSSCSYSTFCFSASCILSAVVSSPHVARLHIHARA